MLNPRIFEEKGIDRWTKHPINFSHYRLKYDKNPKNLEKKRFCIFLLALIMCRQALLAVYALSPFLGRTRALEKQEPKVYVFSTFGIFFYVDIAMYF